MPAPAAELKKAVFAALGGDAALKALVGTRIFEQGSASGPLPLITFGRTSLFDWSTGAEKPGEQLFTLHVWSKSKDQDEMVSVMAAVRAILENAVLDLGERGSVAARLEYDEARYDEELAVHHGLLRFRAIGQVVV